MSSRIPRVVRRPIVAVLADAAEREFDHKGLAHDDAQLTTQRRDQRPVPFPWIGRQALARPGEAGISAGGEQVLDRDRQPLERTGRYPGGECSIGRLGHGSGLLRGPKRVGVQAFPEALVPGNCRFDQFPRGCALLPQIACNLDKRTGERIARHRHLL